MCLNIIFKITVQMPGFGIVFHRKAILEMSVSQICAVVSNGYAIGYPLFLKTVTTCPKDITEFSRIM
jgi:hypothetical protein